jgi:hypothetical protein
VISVSALLHHLERHAVLNKLLVRYVQDRSQNTSVASSNRLFEAPMSFALEMKYAPKEKTKIILLVESILLAAQLLQLAVQVINCEAAFLS